MLETQSPELFNASTFLLDRHIAEGRGDNLALICPSRHYSYGDVLGQVNRLGNGLRELGVEMEDRVLLLSPDLPELLVSLLASMKIGAVPIAANILLPPSDIAYMLSDSRAKVAIAHESLAPVIEGLRPSMPHLRELVVIGTANHGQRAFQELLDGAGESLEAADTRPDDAAVWQYSSGTTGAPKGIIQMHKNIHWYCRAYAENFLGITEQDRFLSVAKLFFGYGQGNSLYIPFSAGATSILMPDRPEPQTIAEFVTRERPTVFAGVPTAYNALLELPDLTETYDFRSIRISLSAGEALPPAVLDRWRRAWGIDLIDGIGCTECFHIFISNRPGEVVPGSSGRLVPGFDAKLVNGDGQEVENGEMGDLLIRGGCVAAGYWNKHALSQRTFQGEWVRTGDKFSKDEEGLHWFAGRGDDMIKSGGIWVAPAEVEATLGTHPAVLECGVVGAPNTDNLIKPKAFVVLRKGWFPSDELTKELKQFVKERIAMYKYPRWIEYLAELPKTSTGKIQRYKLREMNAWA